MEKEIDIMHEEKYADNCITLRAQDICNEWKHNNYASRRVVDSVKSAVAAKSKNGTKTARLEALSYLFALELRIKEKYNGVLRSLFSYYSWKSEIEALELMRKELRIPEGKSLSAVIEAELRKILENEEDDEEDEGTHGGRSNGMAEEEAAAENNDRAQDGESAEKSAEVKESAEEKAEEADAKSRTEEKAVEKSAEKETSKEENKEAAREGKATGENPREKKAEVKQEDRREEKAASEAKNEQAERGASTANENNTYNNYNNSVDVAVTSAGSAVGNKEETRDFIDEIIIDNIAKKMNASESHDRSSDAAKESAESAERRSDEMKNAGKRTEEKLDRLKNGENVPQASAAAEKGEHGNARVPIQVDISANEENLMRQNLNDGLTEQMILMLKAGAESAMREQLSIASAQLGIEAPVQIVGETNAAEIAETKQNISITERK